MNSKRHDELIVVLDAAELGQRRPVGVVRRRPGPRRVISFQYARSWREAPGIPLFDPTLPLTDGEQFLGADVLPGILSDTAPDRWGRRLMERREAAIARHEERAPRVPGEWDFLVGVDDRTRMGALRLAIPPDGPFLSEYSEAVPPHTRLRALETAAQRADDPTAPSLETEIAILVAAGSSLGGGRPKANYTDSEGDLWIAKFPATTDRRDVGGWQFLLSNLAAASGIEVPASQRLRPSTNGSTFAARRFDRIGPERRLFASGMTLTGKRDGNEASYLDLVLAIADYGDPKTIASDLEQLFRRVVFNVLVGNRDDHLRNHGFLHTQGGWRLSPAFDVNPAPQASEHALALDDRSREPDLATVLTTAPFYRLSKLRAEEIVRQIRAVTALWRTQARRLRLPADEIEMVGSAFMTRT
jgi:serine/threonine-protein kinase HipA